MNISQSNQKENVKNSLHKATYQDILRAEEFVQEETYRTYDPWFRKFEEIVDVNLQILYLKQIQSDIDSLESWFFLFAHNHYYQSVFSLRSCALLMEKGLYNDALNLLRSILENLIKTRYFMDNKDQIKQYEINGKDTDNKKLALKTMWEYVHPEAYRKIYGLLSKYEHKNIVTGGHLLNESKLYSPYPIFHNIKAEVLINYLMFSAYAHLNLAPIFFEKEWKDADHELIKKHGEIIAWLEKQIEKQKKDFPNKAEWIAVMEAIALRI